MTSLVHLILVKHTGTDDPLILLGIAASDSAGTI